MFGEPGSSLLGIIFLIGLFVVLLYLYKIISDALGVYFQNHKKAKQKIDGVKETAYKLPYFIKVIIFGVYVIGCIAFLIYIS